MAEKSNQKIILYSTPTCIFCKHAKEYFKEHNIEYEYVDLAEQRDRVQEMVDKSGQMGVPVIDIDGEIIVGFDKSRLDTILGK